MSDANDPHAGIGLPGDATTDGPGAGPGDAPDETMLRRLRIRSWRRGIKEMDLILGAYADHRLATLDAGTVALYQDLLLENDQDLYQWVSGQAPAPARFAALVADIAEHMAQHVRGGTG